MNNKSNKKGFDFDPIDLSSVLPAIKEVKDRKKDGVVIPEGQGKSVDSIIDALFQKMRQKGDFPSFSKQIVEVNKILRLKYSSAKDIADVIMKDFSLSNKLLKLVNSSFYGQFSKDGISSVSSAMIILGADQIQHAAASLMLFEHMQANAQTDDLKDITISTFMSGHMAKDLADKKQLSDTDEFQICAMFHNLGENLIVFYFPEKYKRIQAIAEKQGIHKNQGAQKLLGITYNELGIGIAKKWGLPPNVIKSMEGKPDDDAKLPPEKLSRVRLLGCVSSFSNELSDIQREPDPGKRKAALQKLIASYEGLIDVDAEDVEGLLNRIVEKFKKHSSLLNINARKSKILQNLSGQKTAKEKKKRVSEPEKVLKKPDKKAIQDRVHEEIIKIDKQLRSDFSISEVLTSILEVMHREFEFTRVAICIKDADKNNIKARYGLGKNISTFMKDFHFPISRKQDIFHRSLFQEKDYTVLDVNLPKYKDLIPPWYRSLGLASGFDLYSIVINHVPIGFFYADRDTGTNISAFDQQNSMKKLRNLAEKAIRLKKGQSG